MAFRFIALSEQHLLTISRRIQIAVTDWCGNMLKLADSQVNVHIRPCTRLSDEFGAADPHDQGVSVRNGEAVCSIDKHSASLFWRILSNQPVSGRLQSDQLFIIHGTLQFLLKELCANLSPPVNFASHDQSHKTGSGWLYGQISIRDMVISLTLPPAVVVALANVTLDSSASHINTLSSRQEAILPSKTTVTATLGTTTIRLQDLQRLQIGDVLQLNTMLSDTLKLTTTAGKYVTDAHLAMQDGVRALVLVNRKEQR